jgi:Hemerythrin HHE cation binding domain
MWTLPAKEGPMTIEKSPSSSSSNDTREQILAEHRQIRDLVKKIEDTPDLAELHSGLQQLQPLFEQHFAREEALDGLHSGMRDRAPQQSAAIDALKEDHRQLLAEVAALRARVKACLDGPIQEIETSCTSFISRLKEHEARENEVFLDAIWTDLGTGD